MLPLRAQLATALAHDGFARADRVDVSQGLALFRSQLGLVQGLNFLENDRLLVGAEDGSHSEFEEADASFGNLQVDFIIKY